MVLWVAELVKAYSVSELWEMDIVRFYNLVNEAHDIENMRKQEAMSRR